MLEGRIKRRIGDEMFRGRDERQGGRDGGKEKQEGRCLGER